MTETATLAHIRTPVDRSKLSRRGAMSPHNTVALGAECTGTYCGALITTHDLDRRDFSYWLRRDSAAALAGTCQACATALSAR